MTDADRKFLAAIVAAAKEYEADGKIAGVMVELDDESLFGSLCEWNGMQMLHRPGFNMAKVPVDDTAPRKQR